MIKITDVTHETSSNGKVLSFFVRKELIIRFNIPLWKKTEVDGK